MKKLLTEERLCELAGIAEADTVSLYKTQRDKAKRQRHAAEKDFFGSDEDPLVTTDVPPIEADPSAYGDFAGDATQKLTPHQLQQIQRDVPDEARRPIAMELYKSLIEPNYSEEEIEVIVHNDPDAEDALSQLIGWFHPAFHDSRGKPTYDNPSRMGVQVAQEFEKEGLDPIDDAKEFSSRIEKYMYDETKAEFALAKAHADKNPARNVKVGQSAIPGTAAHKGLQDLFKKLDAEKEKSGAPTGKMKK
jgi:hypothetical protein